ncbi:uncharacterized protein LOC127361776 isoform X2 [Dicentrarchus labrax]|nr:uncharacterized protein LOC127361776 isoform X1 [Dicentrarchus labrax]XP_051252636.1 uncharacterized protein LOC127361776 isoform X2 [Dicentrarchus labrax]XP_051252637.1 uncharacterized protein LOC127361776 isoform X1 [Dicentrarchus labrax]XP_051252638.1 uncharacterized protein LOC127361776 isoform X1 [Dicentrarchus labrax]XP_051252639.1 uncharacterized protein LOC127361776 isoform X2 [Dicentrarchus labrax]
MRENQAMNSQTKHSYKVPTCYLCGQEGHTKPMCPKNPAKLTQMCVVPRQNDPTPKNDHSMKMITVKINGKALKALMDSGSDQTLVHRQFVPANMIRTLETNPICCVHGDKKPYPTADIYIEVQEQPYLNIGVADNLPFPVVLGSNLPVLFDLLSQPIRCNVAVTRAQAKLVDEPSVTLSALPFYDADLDTQPGKSRKSHSRRRQERFQHTVIPPPDAVAPDLPLGFKIPSDIVQMQQRDHSLAALLRSAKEREVESELEYSSGGVFSAEGYSLPSTWTSEAASGSQSSPRHSACLGPLCSLGWPPREAQDPGSD